MTRNLLRPLLSALFLGLATAQSQATLFFSDTFANGSTLNSATPANPTPTNTAYQIIANKAWNPNPPTMTANDLKFGIGATTSGFIEAQALFNTNQIALTQPGDYIQLTVAFTNTSGLLTAAGQLGLGLYNSGLVKPIAGGINNSVPATFTGGAQGWLGYASSLNFSGSASRVLTRPAQSGSTIANQELMAFGITGAFAGSTVVGTATGNATLVAGSNYTEVLTITLNDVNSLAITNTLYAGPIANGIVITNFGGVATNTTFLTSGFDAFAIGYTGRANTGGAPLFDISSIKVDGSVTTISGPPTITDQPIGVNVPSGGSCAFSIAANGFNVTYQWRRNGTNLTNGGNISGATSSQLVISPAGVGDALSGANGYYCVVTGAGPFSTNSITNSLTLVSAKNLIYSGSGPWDLNTSASWLDQTLTPGFQFNYGDSVTFDDNGGGGTVTLTGSYLSASSVTVSHTSSFYTLQGTGSFAGPGKLVCSGNGVFTVNNANAYTGGTIISNSAANVRLGQLTGFGTGPLTFAKAGGKLEIIPAASSSTSLPCDLKVEDDFELDLDAVNSGFALVINGNISGSAGKTLTINHGVNGSGTTASRIRINGTNTVCNANLVLNDSTFVWSPSHGSGFHTYNGVISGAGAFLQKSSTSILNGANTYTGGTTPAAGAIGLGIDSVGSPSVTSGPIGTGPLILVNDSTTSLAGSGQIFAVGAARTVANPIQYASGSNNLTLVVGGTNQLTLAGDFSLNGNDGGGAGTNRTIQTDNTGGTIFTGVISDGGLNIGLIKTGTNTLYLNNTETYSGLTAVAAGTLAGNGSIPGSVIVTNNARIGGGSASGIGTLTIGGNLTFTNGGGFFRLNRSGFVRDQVSVTGLITNLSTNTIVVTNLGATLQVGDTFAIFNKAVVGGDKFGISGGNVTWSNQIAIDGTIKVVPGVNTGRTNIIAVVNGSKLELSWPADHIGWRLQAQTNTLGVGIGTNWVTILGTDTDNHYTNTFNRANGAVFYRMVYP